MPYTRASTIVLGSSHTGLTLKQRLINADFSPGATTPLTTQEVPEAPGTYRTTLTIEDGFVGWIDILNAADDTWLTGVDINPGGDEYLDTAVSSRLAGVNYDNTPILAAIATSEAAVEAAIPPAAAVAAAVWADATATTLLAAIAAIRAADDPLANPVPGHYSRGTAGAVLGAIVTERGLTVVSPVLASGAIEIYRDGSYQDAYNSGIAIPIPDSALDLTDAVLHFVVEASGSGARLDVSSADPPPNRVILSSPTGTGRVAAVQLATATTATAHSAAYTLWAYPPGGAERLPLAQGRFTVLAVARAPLP